MTTIRIRIEHSRSCGLPDRDTERRFIAGGSVDLQLGGYQYLTDDLAVFVDREQEVSPDPSPDRRRRPVPPLCR